MDPKKLSKFLQDKLVPKATWEYLEHLTQDEMLHRLKKYMEMELFPESICKLAMVSHCQLPSDGFTRRASNTSTTRRVYTLTDMTDLMLLNTAKIISCQQ